MMKPGKMISVGSNSLMRKIPSSSIGIKCLYFSRWITRKYGIFYRSESMPALIFHKGFGIKNASKFSQSSSGNNYLSLQTFNYFINPPLQKDLNFFSNRILLSQDLRTCTKNLTLVRCYTPAPFYQNVNRYFCTGPTEKTKAELRLQNRLIQNTGHKEIIYKYRNKVDKQLIHIINVLSLSSLKSTMFYYLHCKNMEEAISEDNRISAEKEVERSLAKYGTPKIINIASPKPEFFSQPFLHTRSFLTSIIPLMSGYSQEPFKLEFACLKPDQTVDNRRINGKVSKIIIDISKGIEVSFFKKKEAVTWCECNVGQTGEVKKHHIHVLDHLLSSKPKLTHLRCIIKHGQIFHRHYNSSFLQSYANIFSVQLHESYKRNIFASESLSALSYLKRAFNFETSTKINAIIQKADVPSLSSVKPAMFNYLRYESIEAVISEVKWRSAAYKKVERPLVKYGTPKIINIPSNDEIAQIFKEYSISSNEGLILSNLMSQIYLPKNNIEAFFRKTDAKMPVVRTGEKPLKRKSETVKAIMGPLLHQNRTLKDKESISVEIWEWKKQFIQGFLHQPSLFKKHISTSVFPTMLSYSHNVFNFEYAGLRPSRTSASEKKMYDDLKITGIFSQDIDKLSDQQIRNIRGLQSENVFNHDTKPEREYLSPSFSDANGTRESINSFQNSFFPIPLNNLKRFDSIIKKTNSQYVDSDVVYSLGELVLKKPDSQKTEIFAENKGNIHTQKLSPTETRTDSGKGIIRGEKIHEYEIGTIADRVYKIIEKRISIEKDRRGLF